MKRSQSHKLRISCNSTFIVLCIGGTFTNVQGELFPILNSYRVMVLCYAYIYFFGENVQICPINIMNSDCRICFIANEISAMEKKYGDCIAFTR